MVLGSGFGYGARQFTPIPTNPASQGAPYFYRSTGVQTRNLPGTGRMVRRAPWNVVPDMEPGADPYINQGYAFTPEGTLRPITDTRAFPPGTFAGALGSALAGAPSADETILGAMKGLLLWGFIGGIAVGLVAGAVASNRAGAGRAMDAAIGSGVGAIAGLAGAVLVGRGATLAARLSSNPSSLS